MLNQANVSSGSDIKELYNIENMQIKVGSNEDWYVIYGEDEQKITISDMTVKGTINSEDNKTHTNNVKLAMAESTYEMYNLMLKAAQEGKQVFCNATKDTSLKSIGRMIEKGLVKAVDENGQNLSFVRGQGLVYEKDGQEVQCYEEGNVEKVDILMTPDIEKLKEETEKLKKFLDRIKKEQQLMQGKAKEEGLDELRRTMRADLEDR